MAGNVTMAKDPNEINVNQTETDNIRFVNGIPQYQDMYMFVELVAQSRGRSVIIKTENNTNIENVSEPQDVNFMGNNQYGDSNSTNFLNFTTNYYDGSTGDRTQFESFGISDVNIKINSSYVPQVNIKFIDIRGLSFFNQEDSPYRILFDFPPPTFTLTVKGYYGKGLKYRLHLVKYTSEFLSKNGNFVIDAEFIAQTFAPLSDIPFRYIINTALTEGDSLDPNSETPPKNTFDLILKTKNLYSQVNDQIKGGEETIEYELDKKKIESIDQSLEMLSLFYNNENLKKGGTSFLLLKTTKNPVTGEDGFTGNETPYDLIQLKKLSEYDSYMKDESSGDNGIKSNIGNNLFVAFVSNTDILLPELTDVEDIEEPETTIVPQFDYSEKISSQQIIQLNAYKDFLLESIDPNLGIVENIILKSKTLTSFKNVINNKNVETTYSVLDVTDFYVNLYKQRINLINNKNEIAKKIGATVNGIIYDKLGMFPTIYNVFEVILRDVDTFFNKIRDTANKAENVRKDKTFSEKEKDFIYPFPLVISSKTNANCGQTETRVSPAILDKDNLFPELTLVNDFMKSFQKQSELQKLFFMKEEKNADGSNIWFPISPLDSDLGNGSPSSPYISTINRTDSVLKEIMKIMVKRFYILSEGVIQDRFYNKNRTKESTDSVYAVTLGEQEVFNLVESLDDPKIMDNIQLHADKFRKNISTFYDFIKDITHEYNGVSYKLSAFPPDKIEYFSIDSSSDDDMLFYLDRENVKFNGFNGNSDDVVLNVNENVSPVVENFRNNLRDNWWYTIFGSKFFSQDIAFFDYSLENVLYVIDKPNNDPDDSDDDKKNKNYEDRNKILTISRFIREKSTNFVSVSIDFDDLINEGNELIFKENNEIVKVPSKALADGGNIVDIWVALLSSTKSDDYFNKLLFDIDGDTDVSYSENLGSLMILSSFGQALSPYNRYPTNLNEFIFDIPAAIETPHFLLPYMGAIIDAYENGWVDEIREFNEIYNKKYYYTGSYIAADIYDINERLSENDKQRARNAYDNFMNIEYNVILNGINKVRDEADDKIEKLKETNEDGKVSALESRNIYRDLLDGNNGIYYNEVLGVLIKRESIINYGSITFAMKDFNFEKYVSIETLKEDGTYKNFLDKYFEDFFRKLYMELSNVKSKKEEEAIDEKRIISDPDITNQMYYSFKNISDKWITNPSSSKNGFPFTEKDELIKSFAFVDRAMNPIGDTIINVEILLDMFDNPNLTLYSALSQILSLNGFEFFPLQNFMKPNNETWMEEGFKIDTSGVVDHTIAFVCLYIGGTSTYPSRDSNGFKNDGIIDLEDLDVTDFNSNNCSDNVVNNNSRLDRQTEKNKKFPYRNVRAFKVRFGEQNQSMFTNIKIDSKEYPETNESIQILSRLAGDNNNNPPTPKGQNLYNLYENRAYRATVTSLGNVMIQPTQYFQLENIPMFNGAYIILDVEHTIVPNRITTKFSGVKILKYPIPRVTNPVVFVGLDELNDDDDFNEMISESNAIYFPDTTLITKYMNFDNAIFTNTGARLKISNYPNASELNNIKDVGENIFDKICDHFGWKPGVNSIFRNEKINKLIGGAQYSQHRLGSAVDIDYDDNKALERQKPEQLFTNKSRPSSSDLFYYVIRNLEWDQIIWEEGNEVNPDWVHISYVKGRNRRKISIYYPDPGKGYKHFFAGNDVEKAITDFDAFKKTVYG